MSTLTSLSMSARSITTCDESRDFHLHALVVSRCRRDPGWPAGRLEDTSVIQKLSALGVGWLILRLKAYRKAPATTCVPKGAHHSEHKLAASSKSAPRIRETRILPATAKS